VRGEMYPGRNLMERNHLEDPSVDERISVRGSSARGKGVRGLDWSGSG